MTFPHFVRGFATVLSVQRELVSVKAHAAQIPSRATLIHRAHISEGLSLGSDRASAEDMALPIPLPRRCRRVLSLHPWSDGTDQAHCVKAFSFMCFAMASLPDRVDRR